MNYLTDALKNIAKKPFVSVLLVADFVVLFCLFSWVIIDAQIAGFSARSGEVFSASEYSFVGKQVATNLSPMRMFSDLSSRSDEEIYEAGKAMDAFIGVFEEKYGVFSSFYPINISSQSSKYKLKSACRDMYKINGSTMIFSEGDWFSEDCFIKGDILDSPKKSENGSLPVILGAYFARDFGLSAGDEFMPTSFYGENDESDYNCVWRVVGILEEDSSYIDSYSVENTNYSVFFPCRVPYSLSEFTEIRGGFNESVRDYITGSLFTYFRVANFAVKKEFVSEAMEEGNLIISGNSFLSSYYASAAEVNDAALLIASSQTESRNFFILISTFAYVLSAFGILISVSNTISKNLYVYTVHFLNGATKGNLILYSVSEISLLCVFGDIIYLIPYFLYFSDFTFGNRVIDISAVPLFILFVNLVTVLLAVLLATVKLYKFDAVAYLKKAGE